jgi:hypothetical protein
VLDLLVLKKDADGSLEALELSDLDQGEIGDLRTYESELAMLLRGGCDLARRRNRAWQLCRCSGVGEHLGPPFASAVRWSGGQLVASGRIPIQALLAAIEADEKEEADEAAEQLAATEGEI